MFTTTIPSWLTHKHSGMISCLSLALCHRRTGVTDTHTTAPSSDGFSGFKLRSSRLYSKCFYPLSCFPSPQNVLGSLLFCTGSLSQLTYSACGPLDPGWPHLFSNLSCSKENFLFLLALVGIVVLKMDLLYSHKLLRPFAWPFCLLDRRL